MNGIQTGDQLDNGRSFNQHTTCYPVNNSTFYFLYLKYSCPKARFSLCLYSTRMPFSSVDYYYFFETDTLFFFLPKLNPVHYSCLLQAVNIF